ncbi:MAG: GDP-mannose 4,6-dehydratase [Amycolatopsis sp.]|jgi:GDPmannose 4,6-dehydratase|uniref:GDP-mannose 4,6-dehydratase n=1 Tax=Amycolatopsis sp. TaxID=37632 RepID=UPI0026256DC5|nr:GDP-mannose 4,6-dehydratase [Amycolatopsis sp.]MCU1687009.1 GDP-mannose 4,6-dehydratase [Amycolatopsis sp.]
MSKRALITGITGQHGSYLAEHLRSLVHQVLRLSRGQANLRKSPISRLMSDLSFVGGYLTELSSLVSFGRYGESGQASRECDYGALLLTASW